MDTGRKLNPMWIAIAGGAVVTAILIIGTIWMGGSASTRSEEAVRSVSLLFLDELAGRREQVVEDNLNDNIEMIRIAINMITEEDLSDDEHRKAFQIRIKTLFDLERFAFIDTNGLIYTSFGTSDEIDEYHFDYRNLTEPEIFVKKLEEENKQVVIAVPTGGLSFNGETLTVCFMELSMERLLAKASIKTSNTDVTFCNLYSGDGTSLSNLVLAGNADTNNILKAMEQADFTSGHSLEQVTRDFEEGKRGVVSFRYKDVPETLAYVPVKGTDWLLTYLVRESVISDSVGSVSRTIINRSVIMSLMIAFILAAVFGYIINENRKHNLLVIEKEKQETESRAKQEELEKQLALKEKLASQSQALSEALAAAEESNKAKTAFLSNMSHEIRTPMNAIIGLDNIALNDPETPPKTREYLEKIGDSANHLLGLINDILDMSRIESGRMTLRNGEFSMPKLIENINTMFSAQCHEKGLEYQCRTIGSLDHNYIGDDMKLRQVLINILGNAVKFTPEGGRVDLTVEKTAGFDGKSTLRFTIADTGIGIREEFLPHLFEAFAQEDSSTTNKYGSSGLGLAITKNIVEMMNGEISVESRKGEGTAFYVTVTLIDAEKKEGGAAEEFDPGEMSVLIVDDDPVACEHAKIVLGKAGITADIAASGKEAVDMVNLRQARRMPYNLILVDWQMPEMDGVETTRQIRAITGDVSAIIILTAYRWDDVLEEAMQAGVDSFISKPLFASAVIEEFSKALRRKGIAGPGKKQKAELSGRQVLLAEDVQINAEIIIMLLEARGMKVDLAVNGRLAVEQYTSHPEGYYDAVLMDMRMPEMDGLTAAKLIRASGRADAGDIPIIALTANAFDEDVQRSLQAGLNAHLSKPVEPDALYETLESLIRV